MVRLMRRIVLTSAMALCAPLPLAAQAIDGLQSVELLKGWRQDDGSHIAAIDIKLDKNWKTYWRVASAGGIPPLFDWTGSDNIGSVDFHWPVPSIIEEYGYTTVGYKDRLVLPFTITPTNPEAQISVDVSVQFGVCDDVCIPVEQSLQALLPMRLGFDQEVINATLSRQVEDASAGGVKAVCDLAKAEDGMAIGVEVEGEMNFAAADLVFIEYSGDGWMAQRETHVAGEKLHSSALYYTEAVDDFLSSNLLLTVLTGGRAFEISGC